MVRSHLYPYSEREFKIIKDAGFNLPTHRDFNPDLDCKRNCGKCYGGAHTVSALIHNDVPCKVKRGITFKYSNIEWNIKLYPN